jgi:diguanylate cyclase (GGDEF)-like protein
MRSGRNRNNGTQLRKCPECGADLSLKHAPRRFRSSVFRAASASGGSRATEPSVPVDAARDQIVVDQARAFSEHDQTLSDQDQTTNGRDQTAGDRDQTANDRDEEASAHDQDASDRDLAAGGDPVEHGISKEARERRSAERLVTSSSRDRTAADRVQTANERDRIAEIRDSANAAADRSLRDGLGGGAVSLRVEAARAWAAADRAAAASDRERAAEDRETAALLRATAAHDRAEAVRERNLAGIDELTGVSLRGRGLGELERELHRARRTGRPLVLAFVDVNNLKAVNDSEGHLAGDALLRRVAETLRRKLRPYDVIVRFGGDEFVCAFSNLDAEAVRRRFRDVVETLEANGRAEPISFGVAELTDGDDLQRLLARADETLIESRRASGHQSGRT